MSDLSISNVVGGGEFSREFDLPEVYHDFPATNLQYEPDSFPALVVRYNSLDATIMLFSSGKFSLAGAKSIDDALQAKEKFTSDIESLLDDSVDPDFEIRYLVCTGDIGFPIDLNKVITLFGIENVEYEPEQFPGLFYRPGDDWFAIIFSSGKIIVDGHAEFQKLESEFDRLKKELLKIK